MPDRMTDSTPATAALRSDAQPYDGAVCPLPRCGKPLHIIYAVSRPVYLHDTADDLVPESGYTQSWYTSVWRDEYGEWVWSCSCSPDLHGGYATAGRAGQEAAWHEEAPDGK